MSNTIQLPDNMTIHHIEGQFNELNKSFSSADGEIEIDAASLETIDTSGLQALLALTKTAKENGKTVSWSNVPETLTSSAQKIGIDQPLAFS